MRTGVGQVIVFVCVFCLFVGYCKWWNGRQEQSRHFAAVSPPDYGGYAVTGAADSSFNGVYIPLNAFAGFPCYGKEAPPRFLWQDEVGWHLSCQPGVLADGYMTEPGAPVVGSWECDGAADPAPSVVPIMVAEAEG
jgi:hypothetical protein